MKILIAWELGKGLGHLARQLPLADELRKMGTEIQWVVPSEYVGHSWLQEQELKAASGLTTAPAPFQSTKRSIAKPNSFSDILWNIGYRDSQWLAGAADQWKKIIGNAEPDLVLADYSPTALVACHDLDVSVGIVGTGFYLPVEGFFIPDESPYPERLEKTNREVANNLNELDGFRSRPICSPLEIFDRLDRIAMATYPELDHFGDRPTLDYFGTWPSQRSATHETLTWNSNKTKRVFVYLLNPNLITELLASLGRFECEVILYTATKTGIPSLELPSNIEIQVANRPIDIEAIARECSFAVTYGGHGTTCQFLRQGVPLLLFPFHAEQFLLSKRVEEFGAGLIADHSVGSLNSSLDQLMNSNRFRESALNLATSLNQRNPDHEINRLANTLVDLASRS